MANIYQSISAVMAEIGAVGKNQVNSQQGFKYRGVDAVMNAINPALVNNKVFIVPEVLEEKREERRTAKGGLLLYSICKIKFTFFAEDGSNVSAVTVGEGMDSGDKATNKAMAVAFKYACFQVFCIPTEEMIDPDAEVHEVAPDNGKAEKPKEEAKPDETPVAETDEEKNKKMMDEIGKLPISAIKVKSLTKRCNDDNVPIDYILASYKISKLEDMNEAQYRNCNDHWDVVKEKANK